MQRIAFDIAMAWALAALAFCVPARATDLTYQNLLVASMKLSPGFDYDNIVDSYMQTFRPAVWQQSHDDEFLRHGKEQETLDMMKKAAAGFDLADPVVIHTGVQFGEYDFKRRQFALNPFSDSTYFQANTCCNTLPSQIRLFLSNPGLIDGLPMGEQAAHDFLDQHKRFGNVDRTLEAEISVRLTAAKADNELVGTIVKAVLRDPMNKGAVLETLPAGGAS